MSRRQHRRRAPRPPGKGRPAPSRPVVPTVVPVVMVGPHEGLVDVTTAASFLRVRKSWVYEQVRTGKLPSFRVGPFRRFRIGDLQAWLDARRDGAAPPIA